MSVDEVCPVARESLVDRRLIALAIRIAHERCPTRRFGSEGHNGQWISTFLTTLLVRPGSSRARLHLGTWYRMQK